MYGSVTNAHIADQLAILTGAPIDHRNVILPDPIRRLGVYQVEVRISGEHSATVTVEVGRGPACRNASSAGGPNSGPGYLGRRRGRARSRRTTRSIAAAMYQAERLPPHSIEAEESVLGSLMLDEEAVFKVAAILKPDDFYRERNRWVYQSCLALYDRREPINQVTLSHQLASEGRFEELGGNAFLNGLIMAVPTSVFVEHYADIVRQTAMLRRLIAVSGQMAALAYEGGPDADAILDTSENLLFHLRGGRSPHDFVHIREVIDEYLESSGEEEDGTSVARILSGFDRMDRVLGGLHRSDLVILAARPGLGKTSLAMNVAYHAAIRQHAKVAVFSLEMTKDQLVERLLSGEAGVDVQRLRLGAHRPQILD